LFDFSIISSNFSPFRQMLEYEVFKSKCSQGRNAKQYWNVGILNTKTINAWFLMSIGAEIHPKIASNRDSKKETKSCPEWTFFSVYWVVKLAES
jgi:hypothetical protein